MKKLLSVLCAATMLFSVGGSSLAYAKMCRDSNSSQPLMAEEYPKAESMFNINIYNGESSVNIHEEKDRMQSLLECIKKDRSMLSYSQMYNSGWRCLVSVDHTCDEGVLDEFGFEQEMCRDVYAVNANYKNTIDWMKENGYWDKFGYEGEGALYIIKCEDIPFLDFWDLEIEMDVTKEEAVLTLEGEERNKFYDFISCVPQTEISRNSNRYLVYRQTDAEKGLYRYVTIIDEVQLRNIANL